MYIGIDLHYYIISSIFSIGEISDDNYLSIFQIPTDGLHSVVPWQFREPRKNFTIVIGSAHAWQIQICIIVHLKRDVRGNKLICNTINNMVTSSILLHQCLHYPWHVVTARTKMITKEILYLHYMFIRDSKSKDNIRIRELKPPQTHTHKRTTRDAIRGCLQCYNQKQLWSCYSRG